ncbi:hypothetical protein [Streptomyces sp. Ncost-T10-10d]|uniref:DUF7144 family membrane protein n=1 Tax=Streptomyces sp. Ncost-T10-10d TaxID=1839774 RepID=UPI00081E945A|nr:hypothetical protein [Streptomyces sp. Ncost-T10-10d]SCF66723.1 hypothetical protein GA0115254_110561 [Streptomyces sp. Ncost-T10-10d]
MAHSAHAPGTARSADQGDINPWAAGGIMFAGVLLLVDGVFGVIKGISGIASDEVYARLSNYTFKFDVAAWGWIHLVFGVLLGFVGWGILKGATWARVTGVVLAAVSLVLNFMWLPYQPIWAIISIAIDTFVIWALCTETSKAVI